MSTRKITAVVVFVIVAVSCIPWIRQQPLFSICVGIAAIAFVGLLAFGGVRRIAALLRPAQPPSARPWVSALRRAAIFFAVVVPLTLTVPHFIATQSGAYKLAVATARRSPHFVQALGNTVREGWFSEGKLVYGNPRTAELSIPVRGQQGKGNLVAAAIELNGRWQLTKLVLECEESGQRIDLLSR